MEGDGNGYRYLEYFSKHKKVDGTMTLYRGDIKYQFRKG